MTPEQRREQAEKEVREKLGWWIEDEHMHFATTLPKIIRSLGPVEASLCEISAYNLAVSQAIALAEAQERIAELEKALKDLGYEHGCEPGAPGEEEENMCRPCLDAFKLLGLVKAALKGE